MTISAGESHEVDPVMSDPDSTATPVPTSAPTATPTPTSKTATPSPDSSPTTDPDDLLEEELATESSIGTIAGEVTQSGELISPTATPSSRLGKVLGGGLLALGGLGILGSSALPLIKKKILTKVLTKR